MDREIIDMLDNYEPELEGMEDLSFSPDRITELTMKKIHSSNTAVFIRRRAWKTVLIAAIIACFMAVTAFAAVYYSMHYRVTEPGETQTYEFPYYDFAKNEYVAKEYEYHAGMVFSFDSSPDGYRYFVHPDWLPSEPTEQHSFYDVLLAQAVNELDLRDYIGVEITKEIRMKAAEIANGMGTTVEEAIEMNRYQELLISALDELGIERPSERYVPKELEEKIAQLAAGHGLTAEESKTWFDRYAADDLENGDIPYQISVFDPPFVYGTDFLLAHNGGEVQIVSETEADGWQELRLSVSYTDDSREQDPLSHRNYIFRFNQEEGYLIRVAGTLDMETLGRVAKNIQVWRSNLESHNTEEGNVTVADIGFG